MKNKQLRITFIGLTLSSSWGDAHAITFKSLIKGLHAKGHDVVFLERDKPWYSEYRDMDTAEDCTLIFYHSIDELKTKFKHEIRHADLVIVGSFIPDGLEIGKWVIETADGLKAFYDIDTPVTMSKLEKGDHEYISPELIMEYDMYLSFTGGSVLDVLEKKYHAPTVKPLYCSVDTDLYYPDVNQEVQWTLGYMGMYSNDRQPSLNQFLIEPAQHFKQKKFVVAGPQYPNGITWPDNVERIEHLPLSDHRNFYNHQRYTLNITRQEMIKSGFAPSVRLFEAAACAVPIISDYWEGLDTILKPDEEILIAHTSEDVVSILNDVSEERRIEIGQNAHKRILAEHSHLQRAQQLVDYVSERQKIESAW